MPIKFLTCFIGMNCSIFVPLGVMKNLINFQTALSLIVQQEQEELSNVQKKV